MASGVLRHLLRRARHHDLAALIATFGSEVIHPDATSYHSEVIVDHQEDGIQGKRLTRKRHQHQQKSLTAIYR
jgi:hypothetical protein